MLRQSQKPIKDTIIMKKLIYTSEALTLLGKPVEGINYDASVSRVRNILQNAEYFRYDHTGSLQQNLVCFFKERGFNIKDLISKVGCFYARISRHGILEEAKFKTLLRKNKFPSSLEVEICTRSMPDESVNPVVWKEKHGHLRPFCSKCGKELYGGEIGWTGNMFGYNECPNCN